MALLYVTALEVKWSFCILDLGNVLTSTANAKTVNGKAESSDSGTESKEEEIQEEGKGTEQSDTGNF